MQDAKQKQNICLGIADDIFTSKIKCFWRMDSHFLNFLNKETKAIVRYSVQEAELTCKGILLHVFKQKDFLSLPFKYRHSIQATLEPLGCELQRENREIRGTFKMIKTSKAEKGFEVS